MPVRIHSCAASTTTHVMYTMRIYSSLLYACENNQLCSLYPYSVMYGMKLYRVHSSLLCACENTQLCSLYPYSVMYTMRIYYGMRLYRVHSFMPVKISNSSHSTWLFLWKWSLVHCALYIVRIGRVIPLSSTLHLQESTVGSYCFSLLLLGGSWCSGWT